MIKLSNLDSQTDTQSANNNHHQSLPALPAQDESSLRSFPGQQDPSRRLVVSDSDEAGSPKNLEALLAKQAPSSLALVPKVDKIATINSQPTTINLTTASPRKIRRNGRIACLPRIQRDMVNHMLWNAVPYKNIVAALDDAGFTVTERNISAWATGGFLEWSLAQEHVLQHRLDQDHMLDFLRRDDAPELPEVGLQAAATRLSQVLLVKLARADDPEAHLGNYSQLVDLLVRLNREIAVTQKQRDDSRRTLGPEYSPARVKEAEQIEAIENERFYSNPSSDSKLPRPAVPPLLPPIPTATQMAGQAREKRHEAELQRLKNTAAMMNAFAGKSIPASKQIPHTSAPSPVELPTHGEPLSTVTPPAVPAETPATEQKVPGLPANQG